MNPPRKRLLLYCLIGSVAIGAALAVVFVLLNTWGWFEMRVILTTILFAVASLCVMACELARTPKGLNALPHVGIGLTILASAMLLGGMWSDIDYHLFWKSSSAITAFAIATVHVCLLSVAPLAGKFKWVYYVAFQISFGLATIFAFIFFEFFRTDESIFRAFIALAIVDTALSLVIPILGWISRTEQRTELLATPLELRNAEAIDREIQQLRQRIAQLEQLKVG